MELFDLTKMSGAVLYLLIAALAVLFLAAWAGALLIVSASTRRRRMKLSQRALWIGLAAILPIAGAIAYAVFLLVSRLMTPLPAEESRVPHRYTQPMPALPGGRLARDTISAAEDIPGTIPMPPVPPAGPPAQPRSPAPQHFRAVVLQGPDQGQPCPLEHFPALIGRSQAASILLAKDLLISRRHAEIYLQAGGLRVRDLGSRYGTRLNGQAVQDAPLSPGDRIQVGASVLVIQSQPA